MNKHSNEVLQAEIKKIKEVFSSNLEPKHLEREARYLMHKFAIDGKAKCIDLLLSYGVDIDIRNRQGETPLLNAFGIIDWDLYEREKFLLYLIYKGADLKAVDNNGYNIPYFLKEHEGLYSKEFLKEIYNRLPFFTEEQQLKLKKLRLNCLF